MTEIDLIVRELVLAKTTHPIRVGIDGFCASGKTTLADALATKIRALGRNIIRVSADDFQNPPEIRWQLGAQSPESFRRCQINFLALRIMLLEPLGPVGSRHFRSTLYDVHDSRPNISSEHYAEMTDMLLLDGLFLHSAELDNCFDFTVFTSADFETCLTRALTRNQEGSSDPRELEKLYRLKYIPGFTLYMQEAHPQDRASFVVRTA